MRLHHVQLVIPQGQVNTAAAFYGGIVGMTQMEKPPGLADRGGIWFKLGELELYIAEEHDFVPMGRAHPGIVVDDLHGLTERLQEAGFMVEPNSLFPGHRRCYVRDPFGNRLEFMEPVVDPASASLEPLDARKVSWWGREAVDVYRTAFTGPPYRRTEGQVAAFAEAIRRHVERDGFVGHAIRLASGGMAGFTYGYTSTPGQWWHDQVRLALDGIGDLWLEDAFEYVELAVNPRYQRLGFGRVLHDALMDSQNHGRALLTTLDDVTAGRRLYESTGWKVLTDGFRFERSTARYVIMGWQQG